MSKTPNPYDTKADDCRCGAWSAGECGCGRYEDSVWRRIWQEGYDAALRDARP